MEIRRWREIFAELIQLNKGHTSRRGDKSHHGFAQSHLIRRRSNFTSFGNDGFLYKGAAKKIIPCRDCSSVNYGLEGNETSICQPVYALHKFAWEELDSNSAARKRFMRWGDRERKMGKKNWRLFSGASLSDVETSQKKIASQLTIFIMLRQLLTNGIRPVLREEIKGQSKEL